MKLFKHYNNWYLRILAILIFIGCLAAFFSFKYLFDDELEEQIEFQKAQLLSNDYVFIKPVHQLPIDGVYSEIVNIKGEEKLIETELYDKAEDEEIPFLEATFYKPYNTKFIKFTIRKSTVELYALLYTLVATIIIIFILFSISLYYLNKQISSKLFAPFFSTIKLLEQNQTFAQAPLYLPKTNIEEFTLLNDVLNTYDENLRYEFKKAAQFTDNASHELQTPIAVISNRIELILESENTDEKTKNELAGIFETVQQMKQTNETLLLLSRLENRSFKDETECNLTHLLNTKIDFYTQFGLLDNVDFRKTIDSNFVVNMNVGLAMILIDNLLSNAIKHNVNNGYIKVFTSASSLTIINTGLPLIKPANEMFNRFVRNGAEVPGIGLGLSIVNEICHIYNFTITYTENNSIHSVNISK